MIDDPKYPAIPKDETRQFILDCLALWEMQARRRGFAGIEFATVDVHGGVTRSQLGVDVPDASEEWS